MKVLIIDDIELSVKGIIDECSEKGWDNKRVDFDHAYTALIDFDPDVVILDWCEDAENINEGECILDKIWDITFRPIVVFSANAPIINIDSKLTQSNMLTIFGKGDESPVISFLQSIEKFANALSVYRKEMSMALIQSLNAVDNLKSITEISDADIGYTLARRTSAFFDDKFIADLSPSWVQYLCPPVGDSLNVCDILRVYNSTKDMTKAGEPQEYYIILTPSCDMVKSPTRDPKVTHVLCAWCSPKNDFHKFELSDTPKTKNIEKVEKMLNLGYNESKVSLPSFSDILPFMTADFKKVCLVPFEEISACVSGCTDATKFVRIASICSPFREQIVWAYMQSSCRPGVPDRNTEFWAKEILIK